MSFINLKKPVIPVAFSIMIGAFAIFLVSCQRDEISRSYSGAGLNGGFENVEDGYPVNWTFFPDPKSNDHFKIVLDSEHVVEGAHSLKLVVKQNGKTPGFRNFRIPVKAGKKYRLSMSVKADGCTFRVNRIVQGQWGKTNMQSDIIINALKPSVEWEKYEKTIVIGDKETYVLFIFLIDGTGTFWCDDIQFEEIR
jgi:hypothetical protein